MGCCGSAAEPPPPPLPLSNEKNVFVLRHKTGLMNTFSNGLDVFNDDPTPSHWMKVEHKGLSAMEGSNFGKCEPWDFEITSAEKKQAERTSLVKATMTGSFDISLWTKQDVSKGWPAKRIDGNHGKPKQGKSLLSGVVAKGTSGAMDAVDKAEGAVGTVNDAAGTAADMAGETAEDAGAAGMDAYADATGTVADTAGEAAELGEELGEDLEELKAVMDIGKDVMDLFKPAPDEPKGVKHKWFVDREVTLRDSATGSLFATIQHAVKGVTIAAVEPIKESQEDGPDIITGYETVIASNRTCFEAYHVILASGSEFDIYHMQDDQRFGFECPLFNVSYPRNEDMFSTHKVRVESLGVCPGVHALAIAHAIMYPLMHVRSAVAGYLTRYADTSGTFYGTAEAPAKAGTPLVVSADKPMTGVDDKGVDI